MRYPQWAGKMEYRILMDNNDLSDGLRDFPRMLTIISIVGQVANIWMTAMLAINSKLGEIDLSGSCVFGLCPAMLHSSSQTAAMTHTMAIPEIVMGVGREQTIRQNLFQALTTT